MALRKVPIDALPVGSKLHLPGYGEGFVIEDGYVSRLPTDSRRKSGRGQTELTPGQFVRVYNHARRMYEPVKLD